MRRFIILVLGTFAVASPAATSAAAPPDPAPRTLEQVNRALEGRAARIALSSGRTVEHAKKVEVGLESTSWTNRGDEREQIATAEVATITTLAQRGFWRNLGLGLGIGSAAGAGYYAMSDRSGWLGDVAVGVQAFGVVVTGAAIGGVYGATHQRRPAALVFEGPVERYAVASRQDGASQTQTPDRASSDADYLAALLRAQ